MESQLELAEYYADFHYLIPSKAYWPFELIFSSNECNNVQRYFLYVLILPLITINESSLKVWLENLFVVFCYPVLVLEAFPARWKYVDWQVCLLFRIRHTLLGLVFGLPCLALPCIAPI